MFRLLIKDIVQQRHCKDKSIKIRVFHVHIKCHGQMSHVTAVCLCSCAAAARFLIVFVLRDLVCS